jgi:murein DD-endopeptidase MepM/ murein hydrolase activator NlpD
MINKSFIWGLTLVVMPVLATAQAVDYYRSPLDIPIYLSANFGEIRTNRFHTGVDIKTQGVVGKPVRAAADGYIARVTVAPSGYGRALYIAHPNGTTTVYAHLDHFTPALEEYLRSERYRARRSDLDAFPDAAAFPVKQGELIGYAGNSGASGGPHLHFEVRRSASSRTLNVAAHGWITTAEADLIPPRITRLWHVDVDTLAGVSVHSHPRAYEVRAEQGGRYSLVSSAPLKAGPVSYFVIETTDRRGDVTNSFGVYRATLAVDGQEHVVFEKDGVLFDEVRYACASVLYEVQRKARGGNEAIMLARKGGNRLGMYKKALDAGVIRFEESTAAPKTIEITVEDDAGNISSLGFSVAPDPTHSAPPRPAGRIASDRTGFVHASEGMAVSIPKGALYEPIFYTQSTVQVPLAARNDSIRPLSPLYRTGDGVRPLHSAMRIDITADIPPSQHPRARLAKVSDEGRLSDAGGGWSNGSVNGSSRDFGTFCVVVDAIPPMVDASFAEGADLSKAATITLTATDNFWGVSSFSGTIDGEWIIFEREASRGRFIHRFDAERLAAGRSHTLDFTCRDGAGNTTTFRRTFSK